MATPLDELTAEEKAQLQEQVRALRSPSWLSDAPDILVWLALAPAWTPYLAKASQFPNLGKGTAACFDEAVRAGFCQVASLSRPGLTGNPVARSTDTGPLYIMRSGPRFEALKHIAATDQQQALGKIGHAIAESMRREQLTQRLRLLPGPIRAWFQLVTTLARTRGDAAVAVGDLLRTRVSDLLPLPRPREPMPEVEGLKEIPRADEAAEAAAGAQHWIEAALPLGGLLGSALGQAIDWCTRRLKLFAGRMEVLRRLHWFLPRKEQIAAFRALLDGPDSEWALHYYGVGGMGKTMLARYLETCLGPQLGLAISRVDFDDLDPDYPVKSPALLLLELAKGLRLQDHSGAAQSRFDAFERKARNLDAVRQTLPPPADDSADDELYDEELKSVISTFADALIALDRGVVLILDTCEELARLRVDGTPLPNVQATFKILKCLVNTLLSAPQGGRHGMRVVFAGRRPLASAGAQGWTCEPSKLPARSYLRLHEIHGFTEDEARTYLVARRKARAGDGARQRRESDAAVAPGGLWEEQINAILIRSRAPVANEIAGDYQSGKGFQYPESAGPAQTPRLQPMIVASLAAWVLDSPSLGPDTIRSADAELYVQERVVERIRHPLLRRLLPAVALLERFDRATLQAATTDPKFDEAFTELRTLEWTDVRGDFVEVESWLRSDLSTYFHKPERKAVLAEVSRPLADHLKIFTLDPANQDKLNWRHLDAAVRVLACTDVVETATWWEQWELRIPGWGRYDRVQAWTDILLGEDGAVGRQGPAHALAAAVGATSACALYHQGHRARLAKAWVDVEAMADRHPEPDGRQRLRLRATAGRLTAGSFDPELLSLDRLRALLAGMVPFSATAGLDAVNDQVLASYLAALEATVEYTEQIPKLCALARRGARRALSDRAVSLAPVLMQQTRDRDLLAFGAAVAARALVLGHGASSEALDWLERGLSHLGMKQHPFAVPDGGFPPTGQNWLGWKAPESLAARLCLEWIRVAYPRLTRPEEVLKPLASLIRVVSEEPHSSTTRSTDEDRLLGAVLALRCAVRGSTRDETETLSGNPAPAHVATDQCNAHRQFPRLQSAECTATAARGDVDRALSLLADGMRDAENHDPPLAEAMAELERTRLAILRRMRLLDRLDLSYDRYLNSEDPQTLARALALRGFDPHRRGLSRVGVPPRTSRDRRWQWLHWTWQGTYTGNDPGTREILQTIQEEAASDGIHVFQPKHRYSFAFVSWSLDVFEALLLAQKVAHPFRTKEFRPGADLARAWWSSHPEQPVEALTLALRLDALLQRQTAQSPELEGLARRVGKRRAAEVALEEGEVLALRLPERAPTLFKQAKLWFQGAADTTGALISQGCLALCLAGLQRRRRGHLDNLRHLYQTYRLDDHGFLPTWETVAALARDPEGQQLDTLAVGNWLPWIVRFCACLAVSPRGRRSTGETPFDRWLRERYGQNPDGSCSLAPELDFLFRATTEPLRPVTATVVGEVSEQGEAAAKGVQVVRRERVVQIDYAGRSLPTGIFGWHEIAMQTELATGESLHLQGKVDGTQPYQRALELDTSQAAPVLRQFYSLSDQPIQSVCLQLANLVNPFCWEAVLQGERQSRESPSVDFIMMYRITTIGLRRRDIRWRECVEFMALTNDDRQERMLRSVLEQSTQFAQRFAAPEVLRTRGLGRLQQAAKQPVHLLFLFGSPLPTWRRDALFQTKLADPVSPQQLATTFPDLAVCVLFDWQTRFVAERSGTEREQACVLRQFAAQLFSHGVPVVLTVPPLPDTLAVAVLQFLIEALAGPDGTPLELLLHGIQRSRLRIASATQLSQENAWELAHDLCLYCNDRIFAANG